MGNQEAWKLVDLYTWNYSISGIRRPVSCMASTLENTVLVESEGLEVV